MLRVCVFGTGRSSINHQCNHEELVISVGCHPATTVGDDWGHPLCGLCCSTRLSSGRSSNTAVARSWRSVPSWLSLGSEFGGPLLLLLLLLLVGVLGVNMGQPPSEPASFTVRKLISMDVNMDENGSSTGLFGMVNQ